MLLSGRHILELIQTWLHDSDAPVESQAIQPLLGNIVDALAILTACIPRLTPVQQKYVVKAWLCEIDRKVQFPT